VIIHLIFPNISIHFNKFIGPACSVNSVDLLIFKEILLEVINRLHFTEIFFKSQGLIKSKIRGYFISGNMSVLLKHSNGLTKGRK